MPELVPIRYGRMLVSPFAFFRGAALPDGGRPRGDAAHRPHGPAVRRRPSVELRRLRRARPPPGVRHQRLRRDAARARSSGTSSGSWRASPSPGGTGLRREASATADRPDGGAPYREAMRRFAGMRNLDVWYARIDVDEIWRAGGAARVDREQLKRLRAQRGQGARRRTACGPSPSSPDRRRPAPDHQRPAADRADRGAWRPASTTAEIEDDRPRADPLLPRHAAARPPPPARASATSHMARKVVGVGSVGTRAWIVLMLGRDDERSAVPAGQGGAGVGARAVPRQERVQQPRPARRRGPAADAGGQRHHARLDPHRRTSTASSGTSTSASSGTARARRVVEAMDPRR